MTFKVVYIWSHLILKYSGSHKHIKLLPPKKKLDIPIDRLNTAFSSLLVLGKMLLSHLFHKWIYGYLKVELCKCCFLVT